MRVLVGVLFLVTLFLSGQVNALGLACSSKMNLEVVLEQGVQVDETGRATIVCTVYDDRALPVAGAQAEIQKVVDSKGRAFYLALGFYNDADPEMIDDLTSEDVGFLGWGSPCDYTACEVEPVAKKGDRLKKKFVAVMTAAAQ